MFGREYWWVCMSDDSETAPGVWTVIKGERRGPHRISCNVLYWDAASGPFEYKYQATDEASRLNHPKQADPA